jgi:CelD/BcsL family acetyltransferase involved in cellulose biosynthesis
VEVAELKILEGAMPGPVSVRHASDWGEVSLLWSDLAATSPHASFFLTPEWVESWIETFGDLLKPQILVFECSEQAVGACLLVRRTVRRGPLDLIRIYLNTAGEDEADSPCIEFNNILCREGYEWAVASALASHLASQSWDEFAIVGISQGPVLEALSHAFADLKEEAVWRSSYYVDLARIRDSNQAYDSVLSRKWRQHLRQSMKLYAQIGELHVEPATCISSALEMLDQLSALHQRTWIGRGKPGAFGSPRFVDFHRRLIRRSKDKGNVQLLRVAAGDETIGFRYNFIQRGKIYCYQSGLNYREDDRYRPGVVVHGCAIQYYLEQSAREYDFLAGDTQYKQSLSTDSRSLGWITFQRLNTKNRVIGLLQAAREIVIRGLAFAQKSFAVIA